MGLHRISNHARSLGKNNPVSIIDLDVSELGFREELLVFSLDIFIHSRYPNVNPVGTDLPVVSTISRDRYNMQVECHLNLWRLEVPSVAWQIVPLPSSHYWF